MTLIKAQLKYLRIAPRKVRLVANALKGMDVDRARAYLSALPKRSAKPILKTLESAVHNAAHNLGIKESSLKVRDVACGAGPSLKRFRPRAFGRAYPIHKRTSHVAVTLESSEMPTKTVQASQPTPPPPRVVTPAKLSELRRVETDKEGKDKETKKPGQEKAKTAVRPWQAWTRRLFQRKSV